MSRFPSEFLDEVRDRVPMSGIVGRFVIWDRRKSRPQNGQYWCCCPLHGEKSPSFHVDDRKGFAHCFGCGWSGDAYKFLTIHAGKTFPEAVEELAALAGVPLPEQTPEARAKAVRRMSLIEVNEAAAAWFQEQLAKAPEVQSYVSQRGISPEEAKAFRLGFAPAGNRLLNAKIGDVDGMVDAGVIARSDDGGRLYDRFTNRLMFPITDLKGRVIAFSGRALSTDQQAKYLNSPETDVFNKGATLYNAAPAKAASWDGATLVTVEGNVDVISSTRLGFATVAPLGTALTENHVTQLAKFAEAPVLCFDGDTAGRKAQSRAIDLILPQAGPNFTARFSSLPNGEDPDSLVRKQPDTYRQAIEGAVSLADALWARETAEPVTQPEQRAALEQRLRTALKTIRDTDTRRAYGEDFKDRLASLGRRPTLYRSNSYSQHSTSPAASRLLGGFHQAVGLSLNESILIGAIVAAPQAALERAESLNADSRLSPGAITLINNVMNALMEAPAEAVAEVLANAGLTDAVGEALAKAEAAGISMAVGSEADTAVQVLARVRRH